jgi:hypothetical protein
MVVDDAVSELKLIEGILKSAGHRVVSYDHGELWRIGSSRSDRTCCCWTS